MPQARQISSQKQSTLFAVVSTTVATAASRIIAQTIAELERLKSEDDREDEDEEDEEGVKQIVEETINSEGFAETLSKLTRSIYTQANTIVTYKRKDVMKKVKSKSFSRLTLPDLEKVGVTFAENSGKVLDQTGHNALKQFLRRPPSSTTSHLTLSVELVRGIDAFMNEATTNIAKASKIFAKNIGTQKEARNRMYIDRYLFEVIGFCNEISSIGFTVVYPEFGVSSPDRIILEKGDNILIISGIVDYMFLKLEHTTSKQRLTEVSSSILKSNNWMQLASALVTDLKKRLTVLESKDKLVFPDVQRKCYAQVVGQTVSILTIDDIEESEEAFVAWILTDAKTWIFGITRRSAKNTFDSKKVVIFKLNMESEESQRMLLETILFWILADGKAIYNAEDYINK